MQIIREQANDGLICFAIRRRCCRPNAKLRVTHADYFVATGARLDADLENEGIAIPAGSVVVLAIQTGNGRNVPAKIATACKAMIANIGEMSKPPMGRIRLRNGLNTGSTSIAMKAVAGL